MPFGVLLREHAESRHALPMRAQAGHRENAVPGKRLAPVDVPRVELGERLPARRARHRAPPIRWREPAPALVVDL